MEDIYKHNKEVNNGYLCCDLSNFRIICNRLENELAKEDTNLEKCVDEMRCLTGIYSDATTLDYSKYADTSNVYDIKFTIPTSEFVDSKTIIKNDFEYTKNELESFFIANFVDGAFEITKEVLKLPFWCVDWSYYDSNNRRFIDACRTANQLVGYNGDEESTKYYAEGKERHKFEEIYCSHYNGGRVRASFKNIEDCLQWSFHHEANEEDGLFWAEQPCY